MMRWSALAFLSLAGLMVWLAGPASAGAHVGCSGNTCSVSLSSLITLKGDVGHGALHGQLPVAPPPCLWQPIGDTTTGSAAIIQQFGSAAPGTPFGVYQSVQQARTLLKDNRYRRVPGGSCRSTRRRRRRPRSCASPCRCSTSPRRVRSRLPRRCRPGPWPTTPTTTWRSLHPR